MSISVLLGKTIKKIEMVGDESIFFYTGEDKFSPYFEMTHFQDCCEHVYIESIAGDLNDLIDSPILIAEESTNENAEGLPNPAENYDSFLWTFYKIATAKGYVDIRWFGASNGYYSESVDFVERAPIIN
jgi:hypothetical protein